MNDRKASPELLTDFSPHWPLDPSVILLNHGSFGACPRVVLETQRAWRDRMERDPVQFFKRDLESLLDEARNVLAAFIGGDPSQMAFVPNTTTGVNAVLRSLPFRPGDELLTTNHAYDACRNALEFVAVQTGAKVVTADIPFPLRSPGQVLDAVLDSVTPKTRLALIDHVTSSTGLIFPVQELLHELEARRVDALVDGAHAPGMLPVNLRDLGAAYYVGNCHKWLCAPKGAAFLYVRKDRQSRVRPLAISHGANSSRKDRSRFHLEFDWTGTQDPSAWLAVPEAIRFLGSILPGGWPAVRERNRALALEGRQVLCHALEVPLPCPNSMIGSLAGIPLPAVQVGVSDEPWTHDPLQEALYAAHRIEVPVSPWPKPPRRLLRISAHLYNHSAHYESLARALTELLAS